VNNLIEEPRKEWTDYGLRTTNILNSDRSSTPYQAIHYRGRLISIVGKHYYVFPHEDVLKVVEPIARSVEATRSNNPKGLQFGQVYGRPNKEKEEHVMLDPLGRSMRADFVFGDKVDVTGRGEFVSYGFSVGNGIGNNVSFSVAPFTQNHVCDNRMYHMASQRNIVAERLSTVILEKSEVIEAQLKQIVKAREELMDIGKERIFHTKKLPLEWITEKILAVKKAKDVVMTRYKEMVTLKILEQQAQAIAKRMPKRLVDRLEWMKVETDGDKIKVKITKEVTQWKAFNDITQHLTYGKRAFQSTMEQYKQLDQILVRARV